MKALAGSSQFPATELVPMSLSNSRCEGTTQAPRSHLDHCWHGLQAAMQTQHVESLRFPAAFQSGGLRIRFLSDEESEKWYQDFVVPWKHVMRLFTSKGNASQ